METSQDSNTTIEIYDYEEMSDNEIENMFKQEKSPQDNNTTTESIILNAIANEIVTAHANGESDTDDNKEDDNASKRYVNPGTPEIDGLESSRKIVQLPKYCSFISALYMFLKLLGSHKNMKKEFLKNFDFLSWFL